MTKEDEAVEAGKDALSAALAPHFKTLTGKLEVCVVRDAVRAALAAARCVNTEGATDPALFARVEVIAVEMTAGPPLGNIHPSLARIDAEMVQGAADLRSLLALAQAKGGGSVEMPQNADQAAMMALLGERWLRDNAPERLRTPEAVPITHQYRHTDPLSGNPVWMERQFWNGHSATESRPLYLHPSSPIKDLGDEPYDSQPATDGECTDAPPSLERAVQAFWCALNGDTTAYSEVNEETRAELRHAVSAALRAAPPSPPSPSPWPSDEQVERALDAWVGPEHRAKPKTIHRIKMREALMAAGASQ